MSGYTPTRATGGGLANLTGEAYDTLIKSLADLDLSSMVTALWAQLEGQRIIRFLATMGLHEEREL